MNQEQVINSALWAAFGDALGFITELGDEKVVQYRLHGQAQGWGEKAWRRRIGGKYGVEISLPAGTYSDDTQLRLAVSRSITGNGVFQREAFAKIELPVWRAYALGAGVGSLAAAENLIKSGANWHSNQFINKDANYYKGGGNGAAMRIQPHIWAATDIRYPKAYLLDVLADAIITHGHGRGILGAAFHAICLASTLTNGSPISPKLWREAINFLYDVPLIMEKELEMSSIWIQQWQIDTKENFKTHVNVIVNEFAETIQAFDEFSSGSPAMRYEQFAKKINAVGGKEVGSGVKTSILAMAAAYLFRAENPLSCIKTVADLLHSDTDTIATMAGALIGTFAKEAPPYPIQDSNYIKSEAVRLVQISKKERPLSFFYPSIVSWKSARSPLEQVYVNNNDFYLAGLGKLELSSVSYENKTTVWSWGTLPFGQSVLTKRRPTIRESKESPLIGAYGTTKTSVNGLSTFKDFSENLQSKHQNDVYATHNTLLDLFCESNNDELQSNKTCKNGESIVDIINEIEKKGFKPEDIGRVLLDTLASNQFMHASEFLLLLYKKYHSQK